VTGEEVYEGVKKPFKVVAVVTRYSPVREMLSPRKIDIKFGTWNIWRLYRAGSLKRGPS
jgi:hypothetical protein